MQIPLKHFEEYIDETILKRGLSYFKKGCVHEPEEIAPGEYEAIVDGSEEYTVNLSISNGVVTEYSCDCPYDLGSVCKHVASVIFYLEQDELGLNQSTKKDSTKKTKSKTASSSKPAKRKSIARQVDELLSKVTYDELKQFVQEQASGNTIFRDLLLASFAQYNSSESRDLYVRQVKEIIKKVCGRYEYLDWTATRSVSKAIEDNLLYSAERQISEGNYKSAVFICTAIMDQMSDTLYYADDSGGYIGGTISSAYDRLSSIVEESSSEEIRRLVFEYCITSFEQRTFADWDWHIDLLSLAARLVQSEGEVEQVFRQIDSIPPSERYQLEEAQEIKYSVLLKAEGAESARQYLEQNIANPTFRSIAIQEALERKDYDKAISLAQDGLAHDAEKYPGLAKDWENWLLKIAQSQNDTEQIILYARKLLLDSHNPQQDYYQVLKETVPSEQWTDFVETIIQDITKKERYYDIDFVASIFVREGWRDRLLGLMREASSLYIIEQYEKYLSAHHPSEVAKLYADGVLNYMEYNMGRSHYENACRYIRRIIKLGERSLATEVINQLRRAYPRRRILMEELNKV